jgi:hypothetical protein
MEEEIGNQVLNDAGEPQNLGGGWKKQVKKIGPGLVMVLVLGVGLWAGMKLIRQRQLMKSQAVVSGDLPGVATPMWNDFKVSLKSFEIFGPAYVGSTAGNIGSALARQLFSGDILSAEYRSPAWSNFMAGHVGTFWSPPIYSVRPGGDPDKGFNTGLGLINMVNPTRAVWENSGQEYGIGDTNYNYWSPYKSKITNFYPGSDPNYGTLVEGTRMVIPGERAIALKVRLTNTTSTNQQYALLHLTNIPNLTRKSDWSWGTGDPSSEGEKNVSYVESYAITNGIGVTFVSVSKATPTTPYSYMAVGIVGRKVILAGLTGIR